MNARWVLYPAVAVATTLTSAALSTATGADPGSGMIASGLSPLLIPALWCLSWLVVPAPRLQIAAAGCVLLGMLLLLPTVVAVQFTAFAAGGLLMGWSLARGMRWDAVLGLGILPVLLVTFSMMAGQPVEEMLAETAREALARAEQSLSTDLEPVEKEVFLANAERALDGFVGFMQATWPGLLVLSFLSHAGLALLLARYLAGRLRPEWVRERRPIPPFQDWEVPFYWVVVLVVGLALIILRQAVGRAAGINLVLIAATLLSVQGLAVQVCVLGRALPLSYRILFWTVVGLFLAPLIMASSVLLGVIDQWLHLRDLAPAEGRKPRE